jgi:hypothetical protein
MAVGPTQTGSIMNDHPSKHPSNDKSATPAAAEPSLGRRRAMLKGLGQGGTLLAAAAPMTSFAVGRVKTTDGTQCTVSGQMSAVMSSGASAQACAAYHPTHFFSALVPKPIAGWGGTSNAGVDLRTALTNLPIGGYHLKGTTAVFYKQGSDSVRKLVPINRPTGQTSAALKVSDVLTGFSPADQTVIALLHGASESTAAYFIAAYFSSGLAIRPANSEKVPFTAADVQGHWGAATQGSAEQLYRLVCVVDNDPTKLG